MKFFLCISLLFLSLSGMAQAEDQKIFWSENEKLTWVDFQGAPDPKIPFHANTSSGLSFSWSLRTTGDAAEFIYDVQSYFYPPESWVKGKGRSDALLAHEQLHFDITELHARKLRQQLAKYKLGADVKEALNGIYQNNEKQRQQMQQRYDRESDHGLEKQAQARWQALVEEELLKLKEFVGN